MSIPVTSKEFTNDSPEDVGKGAIKYDGGKPCIYQSFFEYFPRAMEAVSAVSDFGANKYARHGWRSVDNGIVRYSDAMVRHLVKKGKGEVLDTDSGLPHLAHCAWNALAVLELCLAEEASQVPSES